jgi:hypothetical protein
MTADRGFALLRNRPNPVEVSTTIVFDLLRSSNVGLRIFDAFGRQVETLVGGTRPAGRSEIVWQPNGISDGIYYYRLDVDGTAQSRKLLVRTR